jgi:hypothetical protein
VEKSLGRRDVEDLLTGDSDDGDASVEVDAKPEGAGGLTSGVEGAAKWCPGCSWEAYRRTSALVTFFQLGEFWLT